MGARNNGTHEGDTRGERERLPERPLERQVFLEPKYFQAPAKQATSTKLTVVRVWKGIFGIRDLTKIRCWNRENDKYIDGIRDLTVPREAGLAKNWARDAGFMFACLSGMPETVTTHRS